MDESFRMVARETEVAAFDTSSELERLPLEPVERRFGPRAPIGRRVLTDPGRRGLGRQGEQEGQARQQAAGDAQVESRTYWLPSPRAIP